MRCCFDFDVTATGDNMPTHIHDGSDDDDDYDFMGVSSSSTNALASDFLAPSTQASGDFGVIGQRRNFSTATSANLGTASGLSTPAYLALDHRVGYSFTGGSYRNGDNGQTRRDQKNVVDPLRITEGRDVRTTVSIKIQ